MMRLFRIVAPVIDVEQAATWGRAKARDAKCEVEKGAGWLGVIETRPWGERSVTGGRA